MSWMSSLPLVQRAEIWEGVGWCRKRSPLHLLVSKIRNVVRTVGRMLAANRT